MKINAFLLLFLLPLLIACNAKTWGDLNIAGANVSVLNSTISGTSGIVADGVSTSTISITLLDANSNPVSNIVPHFSLSGGGNTNGSCSPTDASGQSTCTVTSTIAGIKNLQLTSPKVINGGTITFLPGAPSALLSSIFVTTPTVTAGSTANVSVTIVDGFFNPISGLTPDFSISGTVNTLPACSPTDASGVSVCSFSSTKAEVKDLSLTSPVAFSHGDSVVFTAAAPDASNTTIDGTGPILADGIQASTITVTLFDIYNNPVSGESVSIASTGSNNTISACSTSLTNGESTCTLKSTTPESKTVTVTSPFASTTSATVVFNNLAPDIANSNMAVTEYVVADGVDIGTVTITLKDLFSNPVVNYTPTISVTGTNTVSACSLTNGSGISICEISSLELGAKTVSLTSPAFALSGVMTFAIKPFKYSWRISVPGDTHTLGLVAGNTYNFAVDWGDSNTSVITTDTDPDKTHAYTASGDYQITLYPLDITGIPHLRFATSPDHLNAVTQWGENRWSNMSSMFANCSNFILTATDIPDLSQVTSMAYMFYFAPKFNSDISRWDVSSVQTMREMFYGATLFNNGDTPGNSTMPMNDWRTISLTDMREMFRSATSFNQAIDLWNVSKVQTFYGTFMNATSFNQHLSAWNVGGATTLYAMFYGAERFNNGDDLDPLTPAIMPLNWNWGALKANENLGLTFYRAINFNQNVGSWVTDNVKTLFAMFTGATEFNNGCARNIACNPINNWATSNVVNMSNVFNGARYFNQDISSWNLNQVVTTASMFEDALAFNQPFAFTTPKLVYMQSMFEGATAFNQELNNMITSTVQTMSRVFYGATAFNNGGTPLTWDTQTAYTMTLMFNGSGYNHGNSFINTSNVICYENYNSSQPGFTAPVWSNPPSKCKYTFMTTSTYDGNLGGITGADAKCMSDASAPSTGTFKALISDGTTRTISTNWVISNLMLTRLYRNPATAQYYDPAHYVPIYPPTWITTSNFPADLSLVTPLLAGHEFLDTADPAEDFWTGFDDTWGGSFNCSNWTSNSAVQSGNSSSSAAWGNMTTGCDQLKHLFCIEQ